MWTIDPPKSPDVLVARITLPHAGDKQWIMLSGDRHHDSLNADWKLEKRHLDKAKERDAMILDVGDLFDVMQGRSDRRARKGAIRPELQGRDDYFDAVVDMAEDFYGPYAGQFAVLALGNHEDSIIHHGELNLTAHLARRLRGVARENGTEHTGPRAMGYSGWVQFLIKATSKASRLDLYYHHGSGGAAPVTRGTIKANRRATWIDSDFVFTGHIHDQWILRQKRIGLTQRGVPMERTQYHIQTPSYKRLGDWERRMEMAPRHRGCIWLSLEAVGGVVANTRVKVDFEEDLE